MTEREKRELIEAATAVEGNFTLRDEFTAGSVGAAIRTRAGNIYTGICVDVACGIGFCAEHAAIAEMLKARESEIAAVVAVTQWGIIPPCGRCREFMIQLSAYNAETRVIMPGERVARLGDLLPQPWLSEE